MDAPIIDMHGIVKRFPIGTGEELEVLHGIDLTVRKGEFVAIVGASGSGKSTLMNIIGALDRPTEGTYVLDGVDVGTLRDKQLSRIRCRKIGFVFQTFNLVPRTSALKNVALPMMYNGVRGAARTQRARCCFSKRMRKLFRKNEKSVLRFCNKSSKTKRAFTKVLMPCKRPF